MRKSPVQVEYPRPLENGARCDKILIDVMAFLKYRKFIIFSVPVLIAILVITAGLVLHKKQNNYPVVFIFSKFKIGFIFNESKFFKIWRGPIFPKNCFNNIKTKKDESESKGYCWDYLSSQDEYVATGPSTRYVVKILSEQEIKTLVEKERTSWDGSKVAQDPRGVKLTDTCHKEDVKLGRFGFIGVRCTQRYEYVDSNTQQSIEGLTHDYTHCLYKLPEGGYLAYMTEFESIGSVSNNCQSLEELGLEKIDVAKF